MWFLFSCTKEQEVGLMTVQSMWPSTRYTHMLYTVETGSSSPHTKPITQWMHYTALFSTSMLIIPNMDCIHFCFSRYTVYCQHVPRISLLSLPPFFPPSSQLASSNNNSDLSTAVITGWWHVKKEVLASYGNSEN